MTVERCDRINQQRCCRAAKILASSYRNAAGALLREFGRSKSEFPVFLNAIFIDSIEMSTTNRANCSITNKIVDLPSGDLSINQSNEPISANLAALYGSNSYGSPDPNFSHVQGSEANQLKKAKITPDRKSVV